MSSSANIDILIVIDTAYVKQNYPNPSQDSSDPTAINRDSEYMIAADPSGIVSRQGTADLNFRGKVGDIVSFRGTSVDQNSADAVIIYNIVKYGGDQVFNTFMTDQVTRSHALQPNPSALSGIPPLNVSQNFLSLGSQVASSGTEQFQVYFGLYTLNDDGETQSLYGYYKWDPTITVH